MSEDQKTKQGNTKPTADSIQKKVEGDIRKAKLKSFEGKLKPLLEEIVKAEELVVLKREELVQLREDNASLFE